MKFAYLIEPPFNFKDAQAKVTGCDVELARTVLKMVGIDEFEPVETEFAELLVGLNRGDWRMTTGLFATDLRRKTAIFSRPIWALPDGLLVKKSNPLQLHGYTSVAQSNDCVLAVIKDQFQYYSALEFGVPVQRMVIYETYIDAAQAIVDGHAHAYASVGRAHAGFISLNADLPLELVTVPNNEKPAAFGSFAFSKADVELKQKINHALDSFLGSAQHREMMKTYGFNDDEVDLVINFKK